MICKNTLYFSKIEKTGFNENKPVFIFYRLFYIFSCIFDVCIQLKSKVKHKISSLNKFDLSLNYWEIILCLLNESSMEIKNSCLFFI
jgi:hypothetical protein